MKYNCMQIQKYFRGKRKIHGDELKMNLVLGSMLGTQSTCAEDRK